MGVGGKGPVVQYWPLWKSWITTIRKSEIIFKIDIANAYNTIDCEACLAGVAKYCPELMRETKWCLNGTSKVFYGNEIIFNELIQFPDAESYFNNWLFDNDETLQSFKFESDKFILFIETLELVFKPQYPEAIFLFADFSQADKSDVKFVILDSLNDGIFETEINELSKSHKPDDWFLLGINVSIFACELLPILFKL